LQRLYLCCRKSCANGGASGVPRFTEERAKRCQESAIAGRTGAAKTAILRTEKSEQTVLQT
jgi:hypothetical protein